MGCCPEPQTAKYIKNALAFGQGPYISVKIAFYAMDSNIFREYDIRGIVGEQLTEKTVAAVAGAIATFFIQNGAHRIALGYDARASSPQFFELVSKSLSAAGLDVVFIGRVPTPVLYHTVFTRPVDGGVMITGSHNPPNHNGFKICLGKETLFGEQIQEIRKLAESEPEAVANGEISGTTERLDVLPEYIADIVTSVHFGPRKLKVVVDAGNGMGGVTAVPVYQKLGVEVVELYTEPDSTFPNHHADPAVTENLLDLVEAVTAYEADVGIAFDGDGDRIGIVDETGRNVWGDELMILFARSVLTDLPGSTIIGEVKCSQRLFDEIERHGGKPVMWKAGHSLIKSKMKETEAVLAGEMSGHMFFADRFYGFDDACYAGARLLEILSHSDKKLSELLADLPPTFSTPELRVPCDEDKKLEVVRKIADEFSRTNKVITIDGARILFDHGWGLVRASNTQAILVLRFEADSKANLDHIRKTVEDRLDILNQAK